MSHILQARQGLWAIREALEVFGDLPIYDHAGYRFLRVNSWLREGHSTVAAAFAAAGDPIAAADVFESRLLVSMARGQR